ncbi:CRAL/TRIO domain containing protein [Novymonas esmeraldas]|uniref:CRAL/TRIO domain containing protein n=1 Tax=Novymonas esmeraldas TaxID=1808958 RepID=A0AAW0EVK9_9TRYP
MKSSYTALSDLGTVALSHRGEIDEVKRQLDIKHGYFDAWIYGFLENKKFNVDETVSKLHRRFAMEVEELASYELTDYMRESLRKGIIQEIGNDKAGRVAFFINTKRDYPQAKYREEQRRSFDMFVSYGTRLRRENKRCQIVMLINQDGAGLFRNVDMTFQADVALRISKFYPGGVDKMYICKMSRTLAAMAKPIFKRLPAIVADRIQIIDDDDIKQGVLLDLFDADVLPVFLGGNNKCDDEEHWNAYADRVENYYAELKRAVNERGLTVKDYELESLGINPATAHETDAAAVGAGTAAAAMSQADTLAHSIRAFPAQPHTREPSLHPVASDAVRPHPLRGPRLSLAHLTDANHTVDPELKPLMTCLTEESYQPSQDHDGADGVGRGASWAEVVAPLPDSLALFFLDELLRWRTAVENVEGAERYKILDGFVSGLQTTTRLGIRGLDVSDRKWYVGVPYPLRALYRILLVGITVMNVLYFAAALVFSAVFSADVIITVFFGFFARPNYVFPLSAVLLMVAIQGASLCTRAADCILAVYNGDVIPVFERLGSYWGTVAEVILFFVLVVVQFVIFCVYAVQDSPLRGLEISFATGWISALLVVAFTHVFFFTGICASVTTRDTDNRLAALPFFLALSFGNASKAEQRGMDTRFMLRTSSYVICGVPLVISMLLGIGFLISRIVSLYVATFVVALVAAYMVHYYSDSLSNSLSGALLRFTLWMMTLVWCYVTFAFGFQNYNNSYGSSVIVASVLNGIFVLLAIVCLRQPGRSWLLRASYIVVMAYIFGCWVSLFPLVDWRMGLFCLAIMLHNVLNIVFAPRTLTSIHASFFLVAAVMLLGTSCVLLGWYGTTLMTTSPQSLPSGPSTAASLSALQLYHRYPICTLSLGQDNSFRIVDIALLNELVGARTGATLTIDFNNWFGTRGVTYNGIVAQLDSDGISWDMHEFQLPAAANTTVLVLNNRYALSSIVAMVGWVDTIALSPLAIFMPYDWIDTMVYVMSFATRLIPFTASDVVGELALYINMRKVELGTDVILAGSGVVGGFLSAAAAVSKTQAIVFASPGLLHCSRKLGVSFEGYHNYVLSIGAYYGVLNYVGGQDSTMSQRLACDGSALYCMRPQFFSTELLSACGDAQGRRHVSSA